jgi:hypothetical protein
VNRLSAFVVGCIAGTAIAIFPSCSGSPNCTAANCAGCCTSAGKCAAGTTAAQCGVEGSACQACSDVEGCYDGVCRTANGGGDTGLCGGDNGTGGGGGSTGSGGGGTVATGGGNGNTGGGVGSTGGGTATGGSGQGGGGTLATCNSSNCASGCCVGSSCISGASQNDNQCGTGGLGCQSCAAGNNCINGACMGSVQCGPANCGGCCSNNACVAIAQQGVGACGVGGGACAPCIGGMTCTNGVCQTPATLGGPCTSDTQCSTLGSGAKCKKTTSSGNATYTQGYCTVPCTTGQMSGDPCGSGNGQCISGDNSALNYFGESDFICGSNCPVGGTQSTCRNGYVCYGDSTGGFCWIDPLPAFDGGGPATKVGNSCASDSTCQNPPDPLWGFCVTATDSTGSPSGFTNGYCTAECTWDNTGTFCGPNGACFDFSPDDGGVFFACLRLCNNPGGGRYSGRSGYSCFTGSGADGGTIGYVYPSCDQAGSGCPPKFYCNTTSGYCCDGGNCLN